MKVDISIKVTDEKEDMIESKSMSFNLKETGSIDDEFACILMHCLPNYILQKIDVLELCSNGKVIGHGE